VVAHAISLSNSPSPCPACGSPDYPICPSCGTTRDLTSESEHRIREEVRAESTQALVIEREQIRQQERARAEAQTSLEQDDLRNQLAETSAKNAELQQTELDLRRRERDLQTRMEEEEVRRERTEDELRTQIRGEEQERTGARVRALEDERVRLTAELAELQRKHESGSRLQEGRAQQELYGEQLAECFPRDHIVVIRQGKAGADINQTVVDERFGDCDDILHEVKRAIRWDPRWLDKLAADRDKAGSAIAVLVSAVLPPGVEGASWLPDVGVWVVDFDHALTLTRALRSALIELAHHRRNNAARADAAGRVFDYVATGAFAQRVLSLGQDLTAQESCLAKERTAFTQVWATRRKILDRSWITLAAVIGDLEGLGAQLPTEVCFEFPSTRPVPGPGQDAV
jgi:hypothetical protein